jgi:hypothetical protein
LFVGDACMQRAHIYGAMDALGRANCTGFGRVMWKGRKNRRFAMGGIARAGLAIS